MEESNQALTQPADIDNSENIIIGNIFDNPSIGITAWSESTNSESITYSLSNNSNGAFNIDANTGVITLADPLRLNYAANEQYTITVRASNGTDNSTADFDVAIDIASVLRSLINSEQLVTLSDELLNLIPEFNLSYTENPQDLLKTLEISIDSLIGSEIELNLANVLGVTDTDSTSYQLLEAVASTIDTDSSDTVLDISGLSYSSTSIPDDPKTEDKDESQVQARQFGVQVKDKEFSYSQADDSLNIAYDGELNFAAVLRVLTEQTGIITLPTDFQLDVDGFNFAFNQDPDSTAQTISMSVGDIGVGLEGLDFAAMLGIEDPNSLEHQLISAVITALGGVDTSLKIDGFTYSDEIRIDDLSTLDVDEAGRFFGFDLDLGEQKFIYKPEADKYALSYSGEINIGLILRTLADLTGIVEIPDDFNLTVNGFDFELDLEDPSNQSFNFSIGSVANSESGLDLARVFGITDTSSFNYKLLAGIVDTIDGTEDNKLGVADTTLAVEGLSLATQKIIDDPKTEEDETKNSADFKFLVGEDEFSYSQEDDSLKTAYDGTIDALAMLKVLVIGDKLSSKIKCQAGLGDKSIVGLARLGREDLTIPKSRFSDAVK